MYLKSIEVQGFKSFANKLKFEFQQGITGIVGPNGSGKSNVADAVRWVLGEQSAKQLRSGSMQDVIFAGTEARKPQSFASVAITFDNSDHRLDVEYEEVTVTRRLYRSGESEYLLNNTAVRLRDIHEIFYDTGIGQEGYSIIGQGQIDRILSGKADERRELFDEAAGIVKFKKRKAAAQKKLDEEHQNLLRVTDILQELTSQLGPLKKQSETAKIYLDKRQRLKELDINLFVIEEERTDQQSTDLAGKIEICHSDMAETKERFDRTKSEYEEIERQLEEIETNIGSLTEDIAQNAVIRSQLSGQIDLLKEQINTIEASGRQMTARREQIDTELSARETESEAIRKELEASGGRVQDVKARENGLSQEIASLDEAIAQTTARIEQAKNDVIDMLQSRASVKGKIQRYDTMLEQMEIRRSEISGRLLRFQEDVSRAEAETGRHDEEIAGLKAQIEDLRAAQEKTRSTIAERQSELAANHAKLDDAQTRYHRDSSKLDSLRAMAERYDGYGNGIRRIMEQKKRNPGIRGVVADLIGAPKKYETAIETALGGSIRNIVTDNEATAKYLIEYLKSNKLGRATFLPLTSIRPRDLTNADVLREDGVIGVAASLVSTEDEYRVLAEHLLGRIVVVENVDQAIRIGRKYRHSVYMVTLAGESFAPGGSITGGAFKNAENLLGRKREIDELAAGTKELKKQLEALRVKIEGLKSDRNALRDKLAADSDSEQKLHLRLNTVELTKKQAEEQLRTSRIGSHSLEKENSELEQQMAEVRAKSSGITEKLTASEKQELEVNLRAEELRLKEEELRKKRGSVAAELEAVRVEAVSLSDQRGFREETRARLLREMDGLKKEAEALVSSISGSLEEIESKKTQIREVEETIRSADRETEEKSGQKEEMAAARKALSDSHKDFFARRDELSDRMARLDREYFHLTSQKEKIETGREERTNYMWEEYNMTPSEIRGVVLQEKRQDRAAIKKEIGSVKGAIKALGSVNVDAIEDYKNLFERHTFLSTQHEDLVKSERTLAGIIAELDAGMRRQFSEKIEEIRREFDLAFRELFGGGRGSIEIDPDADLLEAGITIIAHPPGKKLQNMMQLSGGEKALTAIALLFAIQNLKPSPFCLLDEIEAALDESNVVRFAEYLHKLTANTQFIIITHRRGTMTAADRLYGITMQEKGVSTLVSVNLIEDKLTK